MNIFKNLWYWFMWSVVKCGLHLYYSKIKVSGLKNIPKNMPVIFAGNHENAFIDALLITTSNYCQDHYLVRAGVFKNRIARAILTSWNLMPVYRAVDGVNPLEANRQIFRACFETLAKKYSVMLFPEGEHNMKRQRRVLKKGISRIALGAINYDGGPKELYIVPVGVNYSDHTGFRSAVHVVYGEPLLIKEQEESVGNINKLTHNIADALSKEHVSLNRKEFLGLDAVFFHDQNAYEVIEPKEINEVAERLEDKLEEVRDVGEQKKELEKAGLIFPFIELKGMEKLKMVLLSPLALLGLIFNLPVLLPVYLFIKKKVKENEFIASIKFGFALFGLMAWWWFVAAQAWEQTQQWTIVAGSLLMFFLGLVALNIFVRLWRRNKIARVLSASDKVRVAYDLFVQSAKNLRGY